MKMHLVLAAPLAAFAGVPAAQAACPYDLNCLFNPYGAGNPYNKQPVWVEGQ